MSTVEERVVRMTFDNAKFEQGVSSTLGSLDKLKNGLKLDGAAKGLTDVDAASKRVSFDKLAAGVEGIANKFKTLSIVAVTALTNIVNKAVNAGVNLAKSLSVSPVMSGLHEYETNLNSIQTIMANTGLSGQKGLAKVNGALADLNHYSDQTIYNFSEMAKNIGTFTAAGVSLDKSTAAIKGIANLAAVSGSNSEQASSAMYQLSQALAAGKVSLEDWNSVVNSGMGGKVFQSALMETARVHGVSIDKMVKDEGGFRNTLQKGWLTSSILTETLNKFTGDLSAKQLKAMGYNKQQIAGILAMGKTAQDAATKVKTMSQLIGTLQEAAGSGWTKTWETLFGNFDEARTLFTGLSNTLGGYINASADARNKVLGDWKALGGRTVLLDSIKLAFQALIAVVKPIKDAFREIFPATTGKQLYDLTVVIHRFAEGLLISGQTADRLKRTFAGVFAILGIGWEIIKAVAKTLFDLVGVATKGSGGFLKFTAGIGDFLVALHSAIANGDDLTNFFAKFGKILAIPINLLKTLASHLGNLFGGVKGSGEGAAKSVTSFADKLRPLAAIMDAIGNGGNGLVKALDNVLTKMGPWAHKVGDFFKNLGATISGSMTGVDFSKVLALINTGLFAALILMIKGFIKKLKGGQELGGGIIDAITSPFEELTKTLSAMQGTLKATTLLEIAIAIGILTISVMALSKIDAQGLTRALTAMTVMFTQLFVSMAIFQKVVGTSGFAKMPIIAASMILLGIAIDVLAIAVKKLGELKWQELAKGLYGVVVLMASLVTAVKFMPPSAGLISTGLGLIVLAGAIRVLVESVTALSGLSWKELAKGLVAVGALLGALILFTKFSDANKAGVLQGAGIILLAVGIKILAGALKDLAQMSWKDIGKGLAAMAGGLTLIGAALYAIPPTAPLAAAGVAIVAYSLSTIGDAMKGMAKMSWKDIGKGLTVILGALTLIAAALYAVPPSALLSAAGIFIVAASLHIITDALKDMATMSWGEIGKSLVVLAGALGTIAIAMLLMIPALPGAVALVIVVAALALLLPILMAFSAMSWGEIVKGLGMLAGIFLVLGIAGLGLAILTPVLLALGVAILLLGTGVLLAGAGVLLFAIALTALAVAGTAGAAAMVAIVSGLLGLIPTVMTQIGLGLIAFAKVIATAGPAITQALVVVLLSLIKAIDTLIPPIVNTLYKLLLTLVQTMLKYVPTMVSTGLKLLTGVLNGIANNIGGVITAATNVVVAFLRGLSQNQPRMLKAGADYIISFINALATTIRNSSAALGAAGANLSTAIVEGMIRGLASGAGKIASKAADVAKGALSSAMHALGIHSPSKEFEKVGNYVNDGFRKGLDGNRGQVDSAFNNLKNMLAGLDQHSQKSISALNAKLKKLDRAPYHNRKAIAATKVSLAQAKKEQKASAVAYAELTRNLADEHSALGKLASQYDSLTGRISAAQATLADAIKTRDDYNKQVKDQYSNLPAATGETKLADYLTSLKKQIEDTKVFANAIDRLHGLGLNDEMLKQLVATGTSALPFVNELLNGGKSKVDEINKLGKDLDAAGASFGNSAAKDLYQAGVDAAAGLVKGLKNQQAAIEIQMDKIADAMVKAIKKKLGIKSPSKVFASIGGYTADGLVKGLEASSAAVGEAAGATGQTAIDSLRASLSGFSDLIRGDIEINPTITPVLDLSSIKKGAGQIGGMLGTQPLSVGDAFAKARYVASTYASSQDGTSQVDGSDPSRPITFNQYNNSPKALSEAQLYRQTKNQLSVAKGALATSANQSRG